MTLSTRVGGTGAMAVAAGTLAGTLAIAGAQTSPLVPVLALAVAGVIALALARPIVAIYLAVLLIPLEAASARFGGFGLSPPEFVALVAAAAWLLRRIAEGGSSLRSPLTLPLIALLAAQIPGLFLADDRFAVLQQLGMWSAFFVIFLAVLSDRGRNTSEITMGVIAAAGGIVAAIAVAQSAGGSQQVFDFGGVVEGRATGSFGGPTALGIFVVMTVPLQIVFMLRGRSPWVRLGAGAATILSILALSLALTRSAYVALGVVAVWLIVAWRPARRLALVVAVLFCILVVTRFNPASSVVDTNVLLQRISSISTPQTHTAQTRLQLWQATPQMIEDNLPFGVGAKNYPLHAPQYGLIFPGGPVASGHAYLHAHDVVLTIGAELGVPGLIALAWIVVALAGALMRGLRLEEPSHSLAIGVTGAFLAIAVDGIFDYSFGTNAIFLTVMLLVACAARLEREASVSETVPRHAIALRGREPAAA